MGLLCPGCGTPLMRQKVQRTGATEKMLKDIAIMKGIIDSTLREGEQAAHVYFDLTEKLRIIDLLIKVGIDEIELGIAAQNPEIDDLIKKAGKLEGCPKLALWCRCLPGDIEETLALSPDVLALSIPVSDIHIDIEHKLGRDRRCIMTRARESIRQAEDKSHCYISLGLEDASRAEPDFVEELSSLALEEGANRIRFADTLGIMDPVSMFRIITRLKTRFSIDIGVHTHNDFGKSARNRYPIYIHHPDRVIYFSVVKRCK